MYKGEKFKLADGRIFSVIDIDEDELHSPEWAEVECDGKAEIVDIIYKFDEDDDSDCTLWIQFCGEDIYLDDSVEVLK